MSCFSRNGMRSGLVLAVILVSYLFLALPGAYAHNFWVNASDPENGLFRANIGYSHDFPNAEPIAADRIHIFEPLQLVTPDGAIKLEQVGENYAYQKKISLEKGSYMVIGVYRPTFWANGPEGWSQQDRTQRPDAAYVEEAIMGAKTIVNVQGATDDGLISKPVGQRLEIVPLANPAKVKVEGKFPMQVLLDGKPAKAIEVEATFAGFSDNDYKAFQGKTDIKGLIDVIPLKKGYWVVQAKHTYEHPDKSRADEVSLVSTLTFKIDGEK
jgi:uncharacterized GH25 family protein